MNKVIRDFCILVSIVFASLVSSAAQQELIVEVMRDSGQILAPAVVVYQNESDELWLPLLEMSRLFGIEFRDNGPLQYRLIQSNKPPIEVDFRCEPIDQGCLRHLKVEGVVYVSLSFWVSRFDLSLKFETESLRLMVLSGDSSQYLQTRSASNESAAPFFGAKNSMPSFLLGSRSQWASERSQDVQFEGYGESLLADGIFSVSGSTGATSQTQWRWQKSMNEGEKFGLILGDQTFLGQEQWSNSRRLRGGRITWNRSEQTSSGVTTDLLELGPPGWEVELFINEQYWDRTIVLATGEFQFLQVPLPAGIVRFVFQFRGPAGQTFQREKQLGFSAQKRAPHELSFDVAGFTEQVEHFAEVEYSPFKWGTLLRVRNLQENNWEQPLQSLKLTQAIGAFAISGEKVVREQLHVTTHQLEWRTRGAAVVFTEEDLRNWRSPKYGAQQTRESRLRLQHQGLLLPFWQWSIEHKEFANEIQEQNALSWRGVGRLGKILNVHEVQIQNDKLNQTWSSQHEFFLLQGLSQYRFGGATQAAKMAQVELGWQWSKNPQSTLLRVDSSITKVSNEWLPRTTLGVGQPFRHYNASFEYRFSQTDWAIELLLSSYLWPSSTTKNIYKLAPEHTLGMAELRVIHFEDLNKNGIKDPGEPPLSGVRVRDLRTQLEHASNADGELLLTGLPANQNLNYEVALESVADIELNPSVNTYFHRLRPHARAEWWVPWVREALE